MITMMFLSTLATYLPFLLIMSKKGKRTFLYCSIASLLAFFLLYFSFIGTTETALLTNILVFSAIFLSDKDIIQSITKTCLLSCNLLLISAQPITSINLKFWDILSGTNASLAITALEFAILTTLAIIEKKFLDWSTLRHFSQLFLLVTSYTGFIFYFIIFKLADFSLPSDQHFFNLLIKEVFLVVAIIALLVIILFQKTYETKMKNEKERIALEFETAFQQKNLEATQQMRRYKHDMQNLFLGMELHLKNQDIDSLTNYYSQAIKPISEAIEELDFNLSRLNHFQNQPLRSLLINKVASVPAQASVTIEIPEAITIPDNLLIRVIQGVGIILDNSLEELATLEEGHLVISCFKNADAIQLIVQNSCRSEIEPLSVLQTEGFSTKNSTGVGLANLESYLADKSLLLSTSVKDNLFTQKITIEGDQLA